MGNPVLSLRVLTTSGAVARQEGIKTVIGASPSLAKVNWRFAHAIAPAENGLNYDELTSIRNKGRTLSPAELSCYASHIALVEDWLENQDSDVLFVVEDDVFLDPWFDFRKAAGTVLSLGLDYLRLYSRAAMPFEQIAYRDRMQLIRFKWSPGGTQAYMLSRAGALRIVAAARKTNCISRPIDDFMDRYWEVGNPLYALYPPAVLELNKPTGIHTQEQVALREDRQRIVSAQLRAPIFGKITSTAATILEKIARKRFEKKLKSRDQHLSRQASSHLKGDFGYVDRG